MRHLRHLGFALWLALALVVGQQGAALHALAHATEKVTQKNDSTPAKTPCETCSQFAGFAGAIGAALATAAAVIVKPPGALFPVVARFTPAPRLAFHSRAPPTLP